MALTFRCFSTRESSNIIPREIIKSAKMRSSHSCTAGLAQVSPMLNTRIVTSAKDRGALLSYPGVTFRWQFFKYKHGSDLGKKVEKYYEIRSRCQACFEGLLIGLFDENPL